jgi:hypothetical protein
VTVFVALPTARNKHSTQSNATTISTQVVTFLSISSQTLLVSNAGKDTASTTARAKNSKRFLATLSFVVLALDTRWDCANLTGKILELTGCKFCSNCTNTTLYPVQKCVRQPFPNNQSFGEISQFGTCNTGSVVVMTTYSGFFGCNGNTYQIGFPTGFCGASSRVNDTSSRMWSANLNPLGTTTTTTTTPVLTSSVPVLNSFGVKMIRLGGSKFFEEGMFP